MASQSSLIHGIDIKEENENFELTLQIKPENIAEDYDESEDEFQDVQLEIKQEESNDLQDVLSSIESKLHKKINEYNSNAKKRIESSMPVSRPFLDIKLESHNPEYISDDYPPLDEGSLDSNDARALNNVEACLQDEVDIKMEKFEGHKNLHKEIEDVTETHLISNKVINTTSTVTIPSTGIIESQTTKTLIMEIHPMMHMRNQMDKFGNPEEILPTSCSDESFYNSNAFQLNSITGNILSLEQEAYSLLKAKKKIKVQSEFDFKCQKCAKSYKSQHSLKKHKSVHAAIERRAMGFIKGQQTRINNKSLKENETKEGGKKKRAKKQSVVVTKARQERLDRRLKKIKEAEGKKTVAVKNSIHSKKIEVKSEEKIILKIKKEPKLENIKKEGYECTCGQVFQRKSRMETCLRSHEIYSDTDSRFPCMSCTKHFKDKDELALHRKRLHRKRFPCKFCPTDYNTRKELFKHLQIHQKVQLMEYKVISEFVKGKQKLKCFMCTKTCSELSELKSHVMEDHKDPYTCRLCYGTFSKIIDFANHTKIYHPEIEGQSVLDVLEAFSKLVKAWKCEECELQFHEADKLAKHQLEKHSPDLKSETQFQCTDCHRVFVSQKGLTSHKRIHHNNDSVEESESAEKGVLCVECRKVCVDMNALTSHMRLHSLDRKFPCKYCDFRFATPEKRKTHSELHTGDMKYVCFICEYQCSSENRLKQHKESLKHANTKQFLLTGKPLFEEEPTTSKPKVSSKDNPKRRKKEKQETKSSPSPEDVTESTCDVCGETFSSEKKMLKHKDKHPFIEIPSGDTTTRIFFK